MYLLVFGFRDIKTKICCSLKGWSLTFMLNLPNLNPFSMRRINLGIAAILGLLTVIIGAFGAHMLKEKLEPESLQSFETGVRYMMYHALALLFINTTSLLNEKNKKQISILFFVGILFFSGSIFAIALDLVSAKKIWFITPIGGLFFILGWLLAAVAFFRTRKS
jgi:uncharacterized membrane protein YgdD (TMEM256/DUF423 family)